MLADLVSGFLSRVGEGLLTRPFTKRDQAVVDADLLDPVLPVSPPFPFPSPFPVLPRRTQRHGRALTRRCPVLCRVPNCLSQPCSSWKGSNIPLSNALWGDAPGNCDNTP